MIALSTIVTAIAVVENFAPEVQAAAKIIGGIVESTEAAAEGAAGSTKLATVLAWLRAIVSSLAPNWDVLSAQIVQLIAAAKAAWNAIQAAPVAA